MMSQGAYSLLSVLSVLLIVFSAFSLIASFFALREVYNGTALVAVKRGSDDPSVKKMLRRKRIWKALSILGILLGAVFPFVSSINGEAEAQHRQQVEDVREIAQKFFIDEVSFEDAEKLLDDKATLEVVSADGSVQELEFRYVERILLAPTIYAMETAGDYKKGHMVFFTAEDQRGWLLRKEVADDVQSRYGIKLNPEQITALEIPTEVPDTLTRYGTVPLTIAVDGGYLNADATLIWDNDFKLVGVPGAEQELLELPIAPSGSDR